MNNTYYAVIGLKEDSPDSLKGSGDVVFLGAFDDIDKALMLSEIHNDTNTTLTSISIVSMTHFDDVPDMDVFISIHVVEGTVVVRSVCAHPDTTPMLKDDDSFEAIGYPEDKDALVAIAIQWHMSRYGSAPTIDERVSQALIDYVI